MFPEALGRKMHVPEGQEAVLHTVAWLDFLVPGASNHSSHRHRNYELYKTIQLLIELSLIGLNNLYFERRNILFKIFISPILGLCSLELPHDRPPSKHSGTTDTLHTVINSTEPPRRLSRLTNPKAQSDLTLTFGVFVNGSRDL